MRASTRAAACVLLLSSALFISGCNASTQAQSAGPPPVVPVTVATAVQDTVPFAVRAVGSVEAASIIQVRSQVAGQLLRVHFAEGSMVKEGQVLFEIDPRPYNEALRQAEAALARDQAQLRQAEANLARDTAQARNAQADAGRYDALMKEGVVSKSQHDQFRTAADALEASISADRAAIDSARASLESDRSSVDRARLDLSYCTIASPVNGRAGILQIHPGNLVKANGDSPLVVIHQVQPIYAVFGVPEQHLSEIRRNFGAQKVFVDVRPQDHPSGPAIRGTLSAIENSVDTATGTIRLKAMFPNENGVLWPGQFVEVSAVLHSVENAIVVPSEAVQAGRDGAMVYVVKPDHSVEIRKVKLGPEVDRRTVIEDGVRAGDSVVTDGHLRIFPGARVRAVPAVKATAGA